MRRHNRNHALIAALILAAGAAMIDMGSSEAAGPAPATSFKEDVMPILQMRCVECHKPGGDGLEKSGLNLESYEGLMKGTIHGPVVAPGSAMTSNLLVLVEGKAGIKMPHNRKSLTKCEIEVLRDWVNHGAKNN